MEDQFKDLKLDKKISYKSEEMNDDNKESDDDD